MESEFAALMIRLRMIGCVALILAVVAGCRANDHQQAARAELAKILADSIGATTDRISYIVDRDASAGADNHLQLEFDTTSFANLSEAEFAARSQTLAAFAANHYRGEPLDSVTVLAHHAERPGVWKIVRMRSYAVSSLHSH